MSLEVAGLIASYGLDAMNYYRGLEDVERAAHGNAQKVAGVFNGINWGSATAGLSGAIGNITGSLGRIAEFAIGGVLVQGIEKLAGAVVSLGREALGAVGSYERLNMSLESLIAREMRNASAVTETVKVGQQRVALTETETAKLAELGRERDLQAAKLQEETERHRQLVQKWGEEGLAVKTHAAQMEKLKATLGETTAEYDKLAGKQGQVVDITQTNTKFTKTLAEVQGEAAVKAQELVRWTEQLAINSPFDQEGVAAAFKMAVSYGFVADSMDANVVSAKRLTQAMIDYAAGSGQTSEAMGRISRALGQIQARGKLAGQEVMQLTEVGVNVDAILAKAFGKSTAEIVRMREQGLIPADKAIKAIVESLESDFGGAAKKQTQTISGLISSLEDIKKIGLRELFTGVFEALKPLATGMVDLFSSPAFLAQVHAFGQGIGTALTTFITKAREVIGFIQKGELLLAIRSAFGPEAVLPIGTVVLGVQQKLGELKKAFDTGGWPAVGQKLIAYLGQAFTDLSAYVTAMWPTWQTQIGGVINRIWAGITGWWETSGQQLATTVLGQIGAWLVTLAGQIWAALPGWIETLKTTVGQLWSAFSKWWETGGSQLTLDVLRQIVTWVGQLVTYLIGQIPALSQTLLKVIGDLWGAFAYWWNNGGAVLVGETLGKIAGWIGNLVTTAVAQLPGWIALLGKMIGDLWRAFVTWWNTGGSQLTLDVVAAIGAWLGTTLQALLSAPASTDAQFKSLGDKLWNNLVTWWDSGGKELTQQTIQKIGAWLLDVLNEFDKKSKEWGAGVGPRLQAWWQVGLDDWAKERDANKAKTAKSIADWWAGVMASAHELVAWDQQLTRASQETIKGFVAGIAAELREVEKAIKAVAQQVVDAIPDPTQLLYNIGRDIIAGLAQGIIDMKDHLLRRAQELFDALPVWARKLLGISSPSKVFAEIGLQTMAGYAAGLAAGAVPVLSGITSTIKAIIAEFAALAGWAADPNSGFGSARAVLEPLGDMLTDLQGILEGLDALAAFVPRAGIAAKIAPLLASLKAIVFGFADLAGWAANPAVGFGSAKAVLEPLGEMLASLVAVIDGVTALAAYNTALAQTQAGATRVVEALKVIIGKLTELGRVLDPAELTEALDLARLLGLLAEGLAAVPTLLEVIDGALSLSERLLAGFVMPDMAQLRRLGVFIAQVVTAVGEAAALVDVELREAAVRLATSAGAVLELVRSAVDAVIAIGESYLRTQAEQLILQFKTGQLARFVYWLIDMLGQLSALISTEVREAARRLSDIAGQALGWVQTAVDAVIAIGKAALRTQTEQLLLQFKVGQLTRFVYWLIDMLGQLSALISTAVQLAAQRLIAIAGPALALIETAVAAVTAIGESVLRNQTEQLLLQFKTGQLTRFVYWLIDMLGQLSALISSEVREAAQRLVAVAGPALGLVKTALEALTALKDYVGPAEAAVATFVTDLGRLVGQLTAWAKNNLTEALVKAAQDFGAATATLFNGLTGALTILLGVVAYVGPTEDALQRFMADVEALVGQLATWAAGNVSEAAAKAAKAFGEATGALFGGLANAVDIFKDLQSYIPLLNSRIKDFLDSVTYAYGLVQAYAAGAGVQAATAATTAFATAAGGVFGMLGSALGVVKQLTADAGSEALTFKRRMADLIERISGTLHAWKEYVAEEDLAAWLPTAEAFGTAIEQVFGVLERALNLFTALGEHGLPSMAQFQDFFDYVRDIMSTIGGSLAGAGASGAGATALGVSLGSDIAAGLATGLLSGTAEVQAAARQLALAVEPGLAGLLGGSYQVTSERRVVVEFTGQAGGGVPLDPMQFELLKSALAYEIRIGA